jgi:hypothetical protein
MTSIKAFLIWYSEKDILLFLLALDQQVKFYVDLGVDMFKDAISVPGVTLKCLI